MAYPVMPLGFIGSQGDNDSYRIERSLRFNSADSAYLNRTPASAGNRKTWTWSGWVKRGVLGTTQTLFSCGTASSNTGQMTIAFLQGANLDSLRIHGYSINFRVTTMQFRDPSAWYHIVVAIDTTNPTPANNIKFYVNGSEITSFTTSSNLTQNADYGINQALQHGIGRYEDLSSSYFNGYLTEINFIDGQALTPSSFGETDAITGRWKAKAFSGTYGTNGFYLKFADNSSTAALGTDSSGNGNTWTTNNFSVATSTLADKVANDSLVDSPTNYGTDTGVGGEVRGNYATLNQISTLKGTIIDGALRTNGGDRGSISTIGMTSGKWYCEMYITALGAESSVGLSQGINIMNTIVGSTTDSWGYYFNGNKYNSISGSAYGATYTTGDTIGVSFDASAGILAFYKNGVSQGTAYSLLTSGPYYFAVEGRSSTSANNVTMNFGQQAWRYAPPAGYKALCTTNLPTPTIKKPSSYMDVVTYTGTGATQTISSLGFSPDLLWTKGRSLAQSHNLFDTLRSGQRLRSDTTGAEASTTVTLGSNGFTLGTESESNNSGSTFIAWAWDEDPIAGFDVVNYLGDGSAGKNISHNLGVAPKFMIVKNRVTAGFDFVVYHASMNATPQGGYMALNGTLGYTANTTIWNNTAPTSSSFTVGTNTAVNKAGENHIAYLWAEVDGFSKIGSYVGNSSANGVFVWCGFRPRYILFKNPSGGTYWQIYDAARNTYNVVNSDLYAGNAAAEQTDASLDMLLNGFKARSITYINDATINFVAFAESPFKYARAR